MKKVVCFFRLRSKTTEQADYALQAGPAVLGEVLSLPMYVFEDVAPARLRVHVSEVDTDKRERGADEHETQSRRGA
jgi:glutamate formiminotransferase